MNAAASALELPRPREGTLARARRALALCGPGVLVAVGYVDPGNWSTDLAAGSRFGDALLCVVVLSGAMAMLLQTSCARLALATGKDLAQATREAWPRARLAFWLAAELAMVATDLAEVLGSAIALQLLFGLPLAAGVVVTGFDVLVLLMLPRHGLRPLEVAVLGAMLVVAGAFAFELFLAPPSATSIARGLVPTAALVTNPAMLYLAVGIVGATVMPHNLYLHSRLVLDKRTTARHATVDAVVSLAAATLVNAAILLLASSAFHRAGVEVAELADAHRLLAPVVGSAAAATAFAIALLAAGQSATITGTLAGQVVLSGFVDLKIPTWLRRIVTRSLALVPALVVVVVAGEHGAGKLLVLSQVVLSLELPLTIVPLVVLSRRARAPSLPRAMRLATAACTGLIVVLNVALVALLAR